MNKINSILIRGVSEDVKKSLFRLAGKNRQSVNQYILSLLDRVTGVDILENKKSVIKPHKK